MIAADFEAIDDPADPTPAQNHPISGTTAITNNVWHHAAATFDGTTWRRLSRRQPRGERQPPAVHPRSDSIQRVALGAMPFHRPRHADCRSSSRGSSTRRGSGTSAARQAQIQATKNTEITSGTNLIGRWGLNEGIRHVGR